MKKINLDKPIWIIGDVHGQYEQLIRLLEKIPKNANICFVGDLIDRGFKSKEVIKLIKEKKYYCVKGNHEDLMINFNKIHKYPFWIKYGGVETIHSYINIQKDILTKGFFQNIKLLELLKKDTSFIEDIIWMKSLPRIIKFIIPNEKPLYVSHSSIKLFETDKKILKNNSTYNILWNRKSREEVNFAINIYGHTIVSKENIFISKSHINIDTGAFLNFEYLKQGKGILTAIEYPSFKKIHSN